MSAPMHPPRSAPPIRPPEVRDTPVRQPAPTDTRPDLRLVPLVRAGWSLLGRRPPRAGDRPGHESAGRVLAIVVAALGLAALVNADALVERAERKPLGAGRDRSLAIWHPVQDVAHVLQLHRVRTLGDALAGDDAPSDDAAPPSNHSDSEPTAIAPVPTLRLPSAAEPLRVWVGGDSMVRDFSESVLRLAAGNPLLEVTTHYEISSGLARPDYYDWSAALAEDMAATDAEVVVIMFGANDGQGLIAADGTTYQQVSDPGWQREYEDRVEAVMDQLHAEDRLVYWVTQPPMRDGDFHARMAIINDIYREAARSRPWVELVETAPLIGDSTGGFADQLPGPGGELEDLRQDDGIHFAREGADKLAGHVLGLIDDETRPAEGARSTTTTEPD